MPDPVTHRFKLSSPVSAVKLKEHPVFSVFYEDFENNTVCDS